MVARKNAEALAPGTQQQYNHRPYLEDTYISENIAGLRNENGSQRLQKLTPAHKKIIALHLGGVPSRDIAAHPDVSCTYGTVIRVLGDPLAKDIIAEMDSLYDSEFRRLRGLANETLRSALDPDRPIGVRLKAVSIFDKRDLTEDKKDEEKTAEDVMMKIIETINAQNVQINIGVS